MLICSLFTVNPTTLSAFPHPSTSCLSRLFPRFLPFHPGAHRPHRMPPSSPHPALAHGGCWRKRRQRSREVLLFVRSLVQQPADGPAALRGQEAPQERGQSAPLGAASGQPGCHGEHRSASCHKPNTSQVTREGQAECEEFVHGKTRRREIMFKISGVGHWQWTFRDIWMFKCFLKGYTFQRCTDVNHTGHTGIELAPLAS